MGTCKEHNLTFITIRDLQDYMRIHEKHVKEEAVADLPTQYGDFRLHGYINDITGEHHLALVKVISETVKMYFAGYIRSA